MEESLILNSAAAEWLFTHSHTPIWLWAYHDADYDWHFCVSDHSAEHSGGHETPRRVGRDGQLGPISLQALCKNPTTVKGHISGYLLLKTEKSISWAMQGLPVPLVTCSPYSCDYSILEAANQNLLSVLQLSILRAESCNKYLGWCYFILSSFLALKHIVKYTPTFLLDMIIGGIIV